MPHDLSMALTSDLDRVFGSASLASVSALKSPYVAGDDREEATTEGIWQQLRPRHECWRRTKK
jgi:hypothetical protein